MSEETAVATAAEVNLIKATKKSDEGSKTVEITYDFGGSMEAAAEKFGADVVYSNFVRAAVITAQAAMRRMMDAGKSDEEIASVMKDWKPGVQLERTVDPIASVMSKFGTMSPEEQKAFIKQLQQRANG